MNNMENRQEFKFYKSYYEVFNELPTIKAKYEFIKALLDKEFMNVDPTSLKSHAKFAYISQKHSIERQCKGFIDRQLRENPTAGATAGSKPQIEKVNRKEKGKVKVIQKGNIDFSFFWDLYGKKVDSKKCKAKWDKLSNDVREKILSHVPKYVASTPDSQYRKNPQTYLNNECWNDEVQETKSQPDVKILTRKDFYDEPSYQRYCSKNNITPEP